MRTIQDIEWETPPLVEPHRDREVERVLRRKLWIVPSGYRYLMAVPWLVHGSISLVTSRFVHLSHQRTLLCTHHHQDDVPHVEEQANHDRGHQQPSPNSVGTPELEELRPDFSLEQVDRER